MNYNEEKIKYCPTCLWIGNYDTMKCGDHEELYCPCCGLTQEAETTIDKWDDMFAKKYLLGKFINIKIKNKKGVELWKEIMKSELQTIL